MMERGNRKELVGVVISDRMTKSVLVETHTHVAHPRYNKIYRRRAKFMAHDETNEVKVGDKVRIRLTRPLSKDKRWRVIQVLGQENGAVVDSVERRHPVAAPVEEPATETTE